MNGPDRFERMARLFDELLLLPPAERERAITERCGDDHELVTELRALLAAEDSGASGEWVGDLVASEAVLLSGPDASGQVLGSWRIVRPLAEGGMGTVYLAERSDGAYEALAAIKLVRGGIPSPQLDAHLRAERQILAGLSHPGIAKLLDGGNTPDGTPFLVMEYIDGEPITDWCDARELDVPQRLRLFLDVCEAVDYAHSALVAHRDLKPNNILVTGDGEPKLLDFGIARLMDAFDESADGMTRSASPLTPAYASPEQVSGRSARVATDVYALGVLLYELLTGRLPIETKGLTPLQLTRAVMDDVPRVPSSVVESHEARRRLSGDLDAVVSRALRKEPEQRYQSVRALADDIERHLSGEPVVVRHDDWMYRTGRLLRRNRGAVSAALVLVLTLVTFSVSTLLQARALAVERDRAEAGRMSAERVSAFLEEILTEADPNEAAGQDVTAREVLDRGAARILTELPTEPDIQASLANVMGRVYRTLGEYEAARELLDSGLVVRRRAEPLDGPALAEALTERGALAYDEGEYEEALALHRESLAILRSEIEGDDARIAGALDWISVSDRELGHLEEAEVLAREVVEMNRRLNPEPNADLANSLVSLGDMLRDRGAYDEAEALGREALEMSRAVYGDIDLGTAYALNQLASTLSRSGRDAEAVPLVREGLAIRREVFGGPHVEVVASLGNLANILGGLERFDEAEAARRESLAMVREIFPGAHPYVAATSFSLGDLLLRMDRDEEAEEVLAESVELHRAAFGADHPNIGYPLTSLGRLMLKMDDAAGAEPYVRQAYDARRNGLPAGHWHVAASGLELGKALDLLGRDAEAEQYLREAFDILEGEFGADSGRTGQARDALRAFYTRRGLQEQADALDRS